LFLECNKPEEANATAANGVVVVAEEAAVEDGLAEPVTVDVDVGELESIVGISFGRDLRTKILNLILILNVSF
jgi:hypothetical protein